MHDLPGWSIPPASANACALSNGADLGGPLPLSSLSDDALLDGLHGIVRNHRGVTAELIRHLGEVDARRLAVERGFSSLFSYAVERLGFSEDEACRRIEAARIARRFPAACRMLESGALSLTVLCLLKPHLTRANHQELLEGVSGSSVRRTKEWLAARFPQPDVPSMIRKLPARRTGAPVALGAACRAPTLVEAVPEGRIGSAPPRVEEGALISASGDATAEASGEALRIGPTALPPPRPIAWSLHPEPLSADRFLVKVTVSREVRDKLDEARDLMRHANATGDLDAVVERALDLLLLDLRKKHQGHSTRPLKAPRRAKGSHVSRAARRKVVAQAGWQCGFVSDDGHRCNARAFLEFDHRDPKGLGGDSRAENLRLRCRAHNRLEAERVYGRGHIARAISQSRGERGKSPTEGDAAKSPKGDDPGKSPKAGEHDPRRRG